MAVKRGLGRGLDVLIPGAGPKTKDKVGEEKKAADKSPKEQEAVEEKNKDIVEDIVEIDIKKIEPNRDQPRKVFEEEGIEELSESIRQFGVLQPLIVRKKEKYYEIIAGERRWRAAKKAGLKKLPVIVREYEEKEILKISLIENIQRENLNAIEEAKAYDLLKREYGLKQEEIAASVSKSRVAITNTMRLLKLDDRVQKMIMDNLISSGHGRALLAVEDKEKQYEIAQKILEDNASVRDTETMVKKYLEPQKPEKKEKPGKKKDEMVIFFENRLKEILGSKVNIKEKKKDQGKIEIEYYSSEELERIIDLIQSLQ